MPKKLLITGGCGFIGHHLIEGILKNTDWDILILDSLTYAGSLGRIKGLPSRLEDISVWEKNQNRIKFVWHDLRSSLSETQHRELRNLDYIWHLAAESHVDRSLENSIPFVMSNVLGTANLLEYVKKYQPKLKKFVYFSCYDEKTRALTKNGLKKYSKLKKGDIVFTLKPKTKEIEEQPIEKVIIQDYEGEMIRFNNRIIDLLVTPNHRIYNSDMKVLEAKDCIDKKVSLPVPQGFKGGKGLSKDLMYLIGKKGKSINPKYITKEKYKGKIWCIKVKNKNFLVERNGKFAFSGNTDEVFGPAPKGVFYKEGDVCNPSNPYSASKESGEAISKAFAFSFGIPVMITRTMNVIGERQHSEKFVPKTVRAILEGERVVIHGTGRNISSRCWIHARNVCDALIFLMDKGETIEKKHQDDKQRGIYHIVGEERNVWDLANRISLIIRGRKLDPEQEIEFVDFHQTRPGHDLRYALSGEKLKNMGFEYKLSLEQSFDKMIRWMIATENRRWLYWK